MPLEEVYEYFRHYDHKFYQVVACQGHEPSEADVAAFEGAVGFRLPKEFREFTMSGLGGLHMEVREELWPRPKVYDVGPFWSFLYGISVFGISATIPEWLDIREQYARSVKEGATDLVPFLQLVNDPERWYFDRDQQIVRWSAWEPEARDVDARDS